MILSSWVASYGFRPVYYYCAIQWIRTIIVTYLRMLLFIKLIFYFFMSCVTFYSFILVSLKLFQKLSKILISENTTPAMARVPEGNFTPFDKNEFFKNFFDGTILKTQPLLAQQTRGFARHGF